MSKKEFNETAKIVKLSDLKNTHKALRNSELSLSERFLRAVIVLPTTTVMGIAKGFQDGKSMKEDHGVYRNPETGEFYVSGAFLQSGLEYSKTWPDFTPDLSEKLTRIYVQAFDNVEDHRSLKPKLEPM